MNKENSVPINTTQKDFQGSTGRLSSRATTCNPIIHTNSFLAILERLKNILPILLRMFPSELKLFLQTQKITSIRKLKVAASTQL